jgi:hypothetical protein
MIDACRQSEEEGHLLRGEKKALAFTSIPLSVGSEKAIE